MEHEKSIGKVIEKILLLRTRKYPYTFSSKLNINQSIYLWEKEAGKVVNKNYLRNITI